MTSTQQTEMRTASCQCGAVTLELTGKPIMAATCYCHSCQTAGRAFAAAPGAPGVVSSDGGTPYVLMRKDRIAWLSGSDRLEEHRVALLATEERRELFALLQHRVITNESLRMRVG